MFSGFQKIQIINYLYPVFKTNSYDFRYNSKHFEIKTIYFWKNMHVFLLLANKLHCEVLSWPEIW